MKPIQVRMVKSKRRPRRWYARWKVGHLFVTRHGDTWEEAMVALLAAQQGVYDNARQREAARGLTVWLGNLGLSTLRERLVYTKGAGWNRQRMDEAVRIYREWRREQTSGTSLGLGE